LGFLRKTEASSLHLNATSRSSSQLSGFRVFGILLALTTLLYFPAAKAGWVIDAAGWLHSLEAQSFTDYVNRTGSHVASLYQFTQLATYGFYKIWGSNVWAWSILYMVLHAANGAVLFVFLRNLFADSGTWDPEWPALAAVLLFAVCPHASEVLIWKACYHYLQGLLFLLLPMYWAQQYLYRPQTKYAVLAGVCFLCSAFALEAFYLAPLLVGSLLLYYYKALRTTKAHCASAAKWLLLPQLGVLIVYAWAFTAVYPHQKPHVYNLFSQNAVAYFSKPPKYLFHILLFGRYWPYAERMKVYAFLELPGLLIPLYVLAVLRTLGYCFSRHLLSPFRKLLLLVTFWASAVLVILMPLPFGDLPLLVFYDRYAYFLCPFLFAGIGLAVFHKRNRWLAWGAIAAFGLVNIYFTVKLTVLWKQSAYVDSRLLRELPDTQRKPVLFLNVPENMQGVPMIGAQPESNVKALRSLLYHLPVPDTAYDVVSFNLLSQFDAVKVEVLSDTSLQVAFGQVGNWWWYEGHGAVDYTNREYGMRIDPKTGCCVVTTRRPLSAYCILYESAGMWYKVEAPR
jgi:hypothetical protein